MHSTNELNLFCPSQLPIFMFMAETDPRRSLWMSLLWTVQWFGKSRMILPSSAVCPRGCWASVAGRMATALEGQQHCSTSWQWPSINQHTPGHRAEAAIPARRLPHWTASLILLTSKFMCDLGKGSKTMCGHCSDQLDQWLLMLGKPHAGPQLWIQSLTNNSHIPWPL